MKNNFVTQKYMWGGVKRNCIFGIFSFLLFLAFLFSHLITPAQAASGNGDSYISGLIITEVVDGTSPFDDDDEAGDDSSDSNLIVRSFDYVYYTLSYSTALTDETVQVDDGNLYVEFILPCAPSVATFNMDYMNWMNDPIVTYYFSDGSTGTSYDDPDDVIQQVLTGSRYLTNEGTVAIPGAGTLSVGIYVGSASNGTTIQPTFTIWMEDNTDDQKVPIQPDTVTVSAAPKYAIKIAQSSEMNIYGFYDLSTGNSDAAQDTISGATTIRGRMESYGITVMMQNDSAEKGLKGLEFISGTITFDITLNEYSMSSTGEVLSDQSGYTPVMWDYNENDRSSSYGEWGRAFVRQGSYAYGAAPFNSLGCCSISSIYDSCYDGGDWTIVQDSDDPLVYHVTITDYSIDTENYIFPTANNTWYKQTEDGTTYKANQACISAGVTQIIMQFPYGDVDDITNVYFKVTADNFAINEDGYDTSASYAATYTLLPPGSIGVGVNFTTTNTTSHSSTTEQLGSTYSSGDAYSYIGNTVRLFQKLNTTSDESVETVIGLIKWDADAFEVDRTSAYYSTAGKAAGSVTIYSYTGYFVGRTSNWESEQEMSDTLMNDSSLHFYTDLDELEADGYICVGVFWVADVSYTASGTPFPQYFIDLTIKDSAVVGETYAAVCEGWASYSDVNPMTQIGSTSEYSLDTGTILAYDLYIAYCSSDAYTAMNKKRTSDAYYIKTEYDEEGNIIAGTHVTGFHGGTSLLIVGEITSIDINIADTSSDGSEKTTYDMDAGERTVSYSIKPYVEVVGNSSTSSEATAGTTTVTVTATLPGSLTYVSGSSMWGDSAITPEVSTDDDGNTILTYTLSNVTVGASLDEITFSCDIGHEGYADDVVNNESVTVYTTIGSTGDNRNKTADFGNYSSVSFVVVKLTSISILKTVDYELINQDGSFTWTLNLGNAADSDVTGMVIADVFPYSGDSLNSSFSGSYEITSITIDFSEAQSSYEDDVDSMAFYVTTSSISSSVAESLVTGGSSVSGWTDLMPDATIDETNRIITLNMSNYGGTTAFYFDIGNFCRKENIIITVSVDTDGNEAYDIYNNRFWQNSEGQASEVASVLVSTTVPGEPVKTVDGEDSIIGVSDGDSITYEIAWTVSDKTGNGLSKYNSLVISDTLPDEVTYSTNNPAYLTDEDRNEITDAGTVSYDSSTNTVSFTFTYTYLNEVMAYEGETYILVIPCTLNSSAESGVPFENTATVTVDNYYEVESNKATVTPGYKILTEVVNGTIDPDILDGIAGEDYTIEYYPDAGYLLDTITVDGVEVDPNDYPDYYEFLDLDADHEIKVVYVKPEASKDIYLYESEFIDNYEDGQSVEGYILAEGDVVEYRISYNNTTSITRTVVITDTLPTGITPTKASDNGVISGQTVTWTLTVAGNTEGYVSLYATIKEYEGSITNSASVTIKAISGSSTENDVTIYDSVTIYEIVPVKWVEDEDGDDATNMVVKEGDVLTYYIHFKNTADTAKVFTVTDTVPDHVTLIEDSISGNGTYSNGVITWSNIPLASGEEYTVYFSVTVDEPDSTITQVLNQATVYVDNISVDTETPNGEDYVYSYVQDEPYKIALDTWDNHDVSTNQEVLIAGKTVEYDITFTNPAKETKTYTITDELYEGLRFLTASDDGTYDSETGIVTWVVDVPAETEYTVSVVVEIMSSAQGAIIPNTATVSVDKTSLDTNEVTFAVLPDPVKTVTKDGVDANNEPVSVGNTLVYGINYYNPSEYMKTFTITDYLPDEVTFVSADQGGTYDAATHSVTWKITMYGKTYNTVYATVTVNEGTEGTAFDNYLAYVQVDGVELYTNKVTNWVGKKTVTSTSGESLSGQSIKLGSTIVYTISTINTTGDDRYMQIYDNIPAGITPISASDGGVINGQEVTWSVLVEAGCLKEVTVTCKVDSATKGSLITNTATVKGIKLTANVSDSFYVKESIATGIAASNNIWIPITAGVIALTAVGGAAVILIRKKRK